jgi:type IV secretion system protein VirB10
MDDEISPVAGRKPWSKKAKAGIWITSGGAVFGLIWLTSQPRTVETAKPAVPEKVGEVGEAWSPIPRTTPAAFTVPPPPKAAPAGFPGFAQQPVTITRIPIVAFQAGGSAQQPANKATQVAGQETVQTDGLNSKLGASGDMDTAVATMLPDRNLFITMGTPIPCVVEQPINTDQPGPFRCKVAQPVYSTSSAVRLLDAGTWIVGQVDQSLNRGNRRAFAVMHRIETPQGCLVRLRAPVGDSMGEAGLDGEVDQHLWQRFRGYVMIALLDTASQAAGLSASNALSIKNGNSVSFNQFQGLGGQLGQGTFGDDANIPPTLHRNQAQSIVVMTLQDLDMRSCFKLSAR